MSDASNMKSPTQEEIAVRAYEIYLERGSIPGDDVSHWLEAEAELKQAAEAKAETHARPEPKFVDSPIAAPAVSAVRSRATVA
ncbi:MAG: DUF2934 domain-containing protein [Candidatus Acidiferrales bacterium]